jgi:hypothetical protein
MKILHTFLILTLTLTLALSFSFLVDRILGRKFAAPIHPLNFETSIILVSEDGTADREFGLDLRKFK